MADGAGLRRGDRALRRGRRPAAGVPLGPPHPARRPRAHRPAHPAGARLEAAARRLRPQQLEPSGAGLLLPAVRRLPGVRMGRPLAVPRRHAAQRPGGALLRGGGPPPGHPGPGAVGRGVDLCAGVCAGRERDSVHDLLGERARGPGQSLEPGRGRLPAPPAGPALRRGRRPLRTLAGRGTAGRLLRRPDRHLDPPRRCGRGRVGRSRLAGDRGA